KSEEISEVVAENLSFKVVPIDYSKYTSDNFITLDC
ncbi:unnamed protein product, partial [marine sediment metagenome]